MPRAPRRSRARVLVLSSSAALVASVLAVATPTSAQAASRAPAATGAAHRVAAANYTAGTYVVTFADEPAATYSGYRPGFAATAPRSGSALTRSNSAVKAWRGYLTQKHDSALKAVGARKLYDYSVTTNGVAAKLTARQATALAKTPGVIGLSKSTKYHVDTTLSPHFLGLDAPGGLWDELPGPARDAGAGIIVGVLDTGIWPESDAFAGGTGIPVPADWQGACEPGERFQRKLCNDKLIGARWYVDGFGKTSVAKANYLSPRDGEGHGSHTSSTAAGNKGTSVDIDGKHLGTGSGMAPGAKVAMYKVCWTGRGGVADGCTTPDMVAAIDDAVADGVDVINFSIGGASEADVLDPVEQAFRRAANAGVFVAASAGNSGPGESTLDHPSPWLTTVAATTFRSAWQAVQLGNGARYVGASTTPSLPAQTPLVRSTDVALASADPNEARLCFTGTLDPAKAAGKVVQCDRGVNARIDKGFEVQRAGGVGLVLTNTSPNSLNGDYHPVPAVHLALDDGNAVKEYIDDAGASATASIVGLTQAEKDALPGVPEVTTFSSRGPSVTTGGDILKPDIAAPGNDVVAAVAPPSNHGRDWDFMSGTSMAAPHVAGIGALLKALHPDWSPAEVKSALMTSTRDTVSSAHDPFAQGAGFVDPNPAGDPGLVYPASPTEWRQYMVSLGVHFAPPFDTLTPLTGSELNQPSIAVGKLPGVQTVTRRVKNVSDSTSTYRITSHVAGFDVAVSPKRLTLAPGEEKSYSLTFSRKAAPLGSWRTGWVSLTDGDHVVRSPIALRAVAIAAPTEVHGDASASGSESYSVTPGFTGTLTSTVSGLVGVTPIADSVVTGPFDIADPVASAATKKYSVVVPAGTKAARFSLDSDDDGADLDLFVYLNDELVDLSATSSADEEVTLLEPAAGTYDVYVNGFDTPGGSTSYHLANLVVPPTHVGNGTVTPSPTSVTSGTPKTLNANWTGLDPAKRWLGVISYSGADEVTLFSVG